MKKEASKELLGQRVAFGETVDEYAQSATQRKIGMTLHGPGHYEATHWDTVKSAKTVLPDYREKASRNE